MAQHQRLTASKAQPEEPGNIDRGPGFSDIQHELASFGVRARSSQLDGKRHWAAVGIVPIIALGALGLLVHFAGPLATLLIVACIAAFLAILIFPTTAERSDW